MMAVNNGYRDKGASPRFEGSTDGEPSVPPVFVSRCHSNWVPT